jgi:threonine dehydrogenase-like Zn-dependent dehydrogenase
VRAAVLRNGEMVVRDDVPEPIPEAGQVLVEVVACGICGSDLHLAQHGAEMMALARELRGEHGGNEVDLDRDVYMGHEFSAKVLKAGPQTTTFTPGTAVTSMPVVFGSEGAENIAFSNTTLGGYGERMLLSAAMLLEVPNGLDPKIAALTEPMAVGVHAVNKSNIEPGEGAIVLGCGPVGLACIAALRTRGIETIVATDFSDSRRALATTMGATEAVDPNTSTAWEAWRRHARGPAVIFEAVGARGMINDVLKSAPRHSRVVVVGVCAGQDELVPYFGIAKEINLQFCLAYDRTEFEHTLGLIANGELESTPMVTSTVGLAGVGRAFEALGAPDEQCKILVAPNA